jgi:hypothetical protein
MMKDITWATVGINYYVELREDRHYYSLPYTLRRRDPPTRVKGIGDFIASGLPLLRIPIPSMDSARLSWTYCYRHRRGDYAMPALHEGNEIVAQKGTARGGSGVERRA